MRPHIRLLPIVIALAYLGYQYMSSQKFTNPETGKTARLGMSAQQETTLGLQSYQQVLQESQTIDSGPEYDQVVRVAKRLESVTGEAAKNFDWQVSVVQSDEQNAFCLPGGKIVVYTGILPITQTEAGLATVLGHEMAHATSHHGAQRVYKENMMNTLLMGASGALGDMDPAQRQTVMGLLGAGAKYGKLLPFSRENETEADEIGVLFMARAGFDPHESISFWLRMERVGGGQPPEFMSTHPAHGTRIERLKALLPRAVEEYQKTGAR
jgi:predicted Zn-dependent protease